jgi:hypothetical protein
MTEKKVVANARNRKLAHGPATVEGRERIRAALLRHGFYAQAEEVAMRALGEDPAQYQALLEELWETYQPSDGAQEGLVIHLTRCTWLLNRAVRMQEGYAVRQAQDVNRERQDRLHAQMMRLKITAETLRLLAQSVARKHYVTTPEDLDKMKNLHQEGVLKEMSEIALALFYQLQAPRTGEDGEDELDSFEAAQKVVAQVKEIFGIGTRPPFAPQVNAGPYSHQPQESQQPAQAGVAPDARPAYADVASDFSPARGNLALDFRPAPADLPTKSGQVPVGATQDEQQKRYPSITAAEWEARERPRQLLENILTRHMEICEEQRKAILKDSLKGPSPYERAAEIAPTHPNARLMRRMQDSCFREARRVTNLLLKLKRHELRMEGLRKRAEKQAPVSRDVSENKRVNGRGSKPLKNLSH